MSVALILLGAGLSRRFGADKLEYLFHGKALGAYPVELFAKQTLSPRIYVTRSPKRELAGLARSLGYVVAVNEYPEEGIASSIRTGISSLTEYKESIEAALFAVSDQPFLTENSIKKMLQIYDRDPDKIVFLGANGQIGNPAIFPAALFPALMGLTGDRGGKRIALEHRELIRIAEADHFRELIDIDTLEQAKEHIRL